ncbi:hypothetical protein GE061_000960 [Apolygus lucorum]|uniref:BTB domain-containing protein n=1 Tax=Apolygus lucorum TaxID=248454 RepID=A0A8S9Y8N9_APOLU|nr:hypothetical protein GE061_000960 [Apolygus lucorum]
MPLPDQMESTAQQYCLRWKYHHSNLQVMFAQLLERESFCDVTLACEGKTLRAHKMMLSACSTYFDTIFSKHEEKDPIVILKDVKFDDIKALVEFMYKGEINVENSQLNTLLQTAEELRIKGLAAVSWQSEGEGGTWRTVDPQQANNTDNKQQTYKFPQTLPRKRKIKSDYPYYSNRKVSCLSGSQQSTDDFGGRRALEKSESGGDDDSQEGMWDTRSHEEVYSESEDGRSRIANLLETTPNNLCIPSVIEGEGVVKTEMDPPMFENHLYRWWGSGGGPGIVPSALTAAQIKPELMDVIKMTAYIQQGGRRPHFWETSSTKRVMEAIKNKEIEMKVAAELLGVSYGTLYGRYRDAYGCLKHPYRVREFWHEPPSVEVITKLQRKELSLFKAAEMLNVTVTTLANYLAALNKEDMVEELEDDSDSVACAQQVLSKIPDITIEKGEKR